MKKLFTIALLLVTMVSFAQMDEILDNSNQYYISAGMSVSTTSDFQANSYPSVELGVMKENVSVGAVIGRNDLQNIAQNESFNNYWYEVKGAVYQPLGAVDGFILAGVGNYVDNRNMFIEYGIGVTRSFNNVGYFIQVSNWDCVNYFSGGLSVPLN